MKLDGVTIAGRVAAGAAAGTLLIQVLSAAGRARGYTRLNQLLDIHSKTENGELLHVRKAAEAEVWSVSSNVGGGMQSRLNRSASSSAHNPWWAASRPVPIPGKPRGGD